MENPQIGQRWLVDTDASLGLGIVTDWDARRVTLAFPARDEQRQYARSSAPLTRVLFAAGDTVNTDDGRQHRIQRVEVIDQLRIYISDNGDSIPESRLAASMRLNQPLRRLLAGQLDAPAWFTVRERLVKAQQHWRQSDVAGLLGARITLTPHQLYVAKAATSRLPVRVLLADEVGLGKTIEAGLILQRLHHQQLVNRVLIIVPEALCVQWLVELLRCFSIAARLVDNDTELGDARVFIAPHDFLTHPRSVSTDPWDMVIIDEVHHFALVDTTAEGDHLRRLASHTRHLLLLSATPERLGPYSHFCRLQLLDPEKFHNFEAFQQASRRYQVVAEELQSLLNDSAEAISPTQRETLAHYFALPPDNTLPKSSLIELLLDSHGTGRVVFRNTRQGVAGFPRRHLVRHDIGPFNADTGDAGNNQRGGKGAEATGQQQNAMTEQDLRQHKQQWLADFVKAHRDEKLLLITHEQAEVLRLKEWLYRKTGIDCPVFHEAMTLVERDRAAAYFADSEEGAPLLLCSEIGSEGRNFQFCRRLICWDLPAHPDLLEQRIGRLDRIGQTGDIEIHVCVDTPAAASRLHWLHHVLNAVETINPAAGAIHDQWFEQYSNNPRATEPQVKHALADLLRQLEQGRDRLLEINSCRQPEADQLVQAVQRQERDNHPQALLEKIADVLHLHYEPLGNNRYQLVPSDQMLVPMVPGIPAEGTELTYDRATACAREDLAFITWDHPLMHGLADMINLSDMGVASVGLLPGKRLRPGMLFAEILFTLALQSAHAPDSERYLTESGLRIVVTADNDGNLAQALPSEQLAPLVTDAAEPVRQALLKKGAGPINALVERAQRLAQVEAGRIIQASLQQLHRRSELEVARLQQLRRHNGGITQSDVARVNTHYAAIARGLSDACQPVLTAIRLLVTHQP